MEILKNFNNRDGGVDSKTDMKPYLNKNQPNNNNLDELNKSKEIEIKDNDKVVEKGNKLSFKKKELELNENLNSEIENNNDIPKNNNINTKS